MSAGSTFTLDQLSRRLLWEDIDVAYLTEWLCFCRQEDFLGKGLRKPPVHAEDVTTNCVQGKMEGAAVLKAKVPLWVCGLGLVPLILEQYGEACSFVPYASDGKKVGAGESLGMIKGNAAVLLEAERLVLNCLQHLSGIATQTARYLPYFDSSSTRLLDTRKTTPGWRILEKYAVACAGGWNHRFGLFDRILFKDNHRALAVARGVPFTEFLKQAKSRYPELPLEVEVDELEQIAPLLELGVDIILLDNFSTADLACAVNLIGNAAYTEASGNITLERLPELVELGLDFISSGALTHQSVWVDISLDWQW